jgi:RNase H-fold protein (predicted Holliday junction resolvase)
MATLGISTNTRLLGLAIINRDRLVDYSIHLHKSSWSPSKADKIITTLEPCARRYCIKKVVLSIPYEYHQTKASKYLISRIRKHFEAKGVSVHSETPETLYSFCPPGQKKTKKALMKSLAERFPELSYFYFKEMRNKNKYYIKLFEAIAVAVHREQMF